MSTRIDDTDSRFDYKDSLWQSSGESGDFMATAHSTSTPGAQVVFGPFQGSSITIFGRVGADQPTMHYFIDSGSQSVDAKHPSEGGSPLFQQQLYQAADLDTTRNHTLQINQLDSGTFTLDYVVVGITSNLIGQLSIVSGTALGTTAPPAVNVGPSPSSSPSNTSPSGQPASLSSLSGFSGITTQTPPLSPSSISVPTLRPASNVSSHSNTRIIVVGAVIGSVVFLGVALTLLMICLRRRRQLHRPNDSNRISQNAFLTPSSRSRPSLRLQIPNVLIWGSSKQHSSSAFLPTHKASASATSTNPSTITIGTGSSNNLKGNNSSRTLPPVPPPAFLFEDPNESPIFDIKQRPVSGMTMTTRVTVGTNIGHRVSEPDFSTYPLPEAPPLPDISIRERLENSRFGLGGRTSPRMNADLEQTTSSPEVPSANFNSTASATTASSIPATVLPFMLTSSGSIRSPPLSLSFSDLQLFGADDNDVDRFIHQDAGVTLASNLPTSRRRREGRKRRIDLPPPYQDYD